MGPAVFSAPRFEGARENYVMVVPAVELRYRRDVFFASAREGVGGVLYEENGFKFGPLLKYHFARKSGDSEYLAGLGDVPFAVEAGGFVKYEGSRYFVVRAEVRRGMTGHRGGIFDLNVDARFRFPGEILMSLGPRFSFTDQSFNQTYFGVNADQARNSQYSEFYPSSGARSIGISTLILWRAGENISLTFFGGFQYLGDAVASSPIVSGPGGSRRQFMTGASVTWRF